MNGEWQPAASAPFPAPCHAWRFPSLLSEWSRPDFPPRPGGIHHQNPWERPRLAVTPAPIRGA